MIKPLKILMSSKAPAYKLSSLGFNGDGIRNWPGGSADFWQWDKKYFCCYNIDGRYQPEGCK